MAILRGAAVGMLSVAAATTTMMMMTSTVDGMSIDPSNDPCKHPMNAIIAENCLPGVPSTEWDVNGAGDPMIQGFSADISYNVGSTAEFKVNTSALDFRVDIYRTGYYGGLGARKITTVKPFVAPGTRRVNDRSFYYQEPCHRDAHTHVYDCGNWNINAKWTIPQDAISGVYLARIVITDGTPMNTWRTDNSQAGEDPRFAMPGGESMKRPKAAPHAYGANGMGRLRNPLKEPQASLIYFVVRQDDKKSDLLFQTSDTVWQAYNHAGGTSSYGSYDPANPKRRCYVSSYNRPLTTRAVRPVNAYFGAEYPFVRFLERYGFDVTYQAGVDTDRLGVNQLLMHRAFLSVGHDEYWSGPQRKNVERARDQGLHLAFFSGNEMFWRVRWEDNYRNMVVYKESQDVVKIDPNQTEWTGTFRDSRPINPLGANPENAVTGQIFTMNAWRNDPLVVPYAYSFLRQWRHTKVSRLPKGHAAILHRGILGHEMDEDVNNGFRPKNMIRLSETQIDNVMYVQDWGSTYDSGSAIHTLTLYKHENSGAIVFGAGTVQWGWALDGMHDSETGIPAPAVNHLNIRIGNDILAPEIAIQQFTVNLFADMHVPCPLCSGGFTGTSMMEFKTVGSGYDALAASASHRLKVMSEEHELRKKQYSASPSLGGVSDAADGINRNNDADHLTVPRIHHDNDASKPEGSYQVKGKRHNPNREGYMEQVRQRTTGSQSHSLPVGDGTSASRSLSPDLTGAVGAGGAGAAGVGRGGGDQSASASYNPNMKSYADLVAAGGGHTPTIGMTIDSESILEEHQWHTVAQASGGQQLVFARPSRDVQAPTCKIVNFKIDEVNGYQPEHAPPGHRSHVIVEVEASDESSNGFGGVVAGVEVSIFPSTHWNPLWKVDRSSSSSGGGFDFARESKDVHQRATLWKGRFEVKGGVHKDVEQLKVLCRATDDSLNSQVVPSVYEYQSGSLFVPPGAVDVSPKGWSEAVRRHQEEEAAKNRAREDEL